MRWIVPALALSGTLACGRAPTSELDDPGYSLYALVTTIDGTSFGPPLGPTIAPAGQFDPTLLARLQVVLEAEDAAAHVTTLGTFSSSTEPRLTLLAPHELYWMNVPAAAYFTDPALAYRFRVLLDRREIGRSDMSSRIFEVMRYVPAVPVGVKLRIETRPAPALAAIAPTTLVAGSSDFVLTVTGANFAGDSVVTFAGQNLATTHRSATELTAVVPATSIAQTGRFDVAVTTPAPGGGTSGAATFVSENPTPRLTALSPARATRGDAAFTLTLTGGSFVGGARASFGGTVLETTFSSSGQLTATVPASALQAAGEISVLVTNPDPGGPSEPLAFVVENPTPVISALTPARVVLGAAATTLTIDGASFVSGAEATFAGTALATTFVSSSRLTALVPAGLLAAAGSANVLVTNPAPAVGPSGSAAFSIDNPTPAIASLSPATAVAGGAAFVLTVNGSAFVAGAQVTFAGAALATTFVSATQLFVTVPSSAVAAAGSRSVTVSNPTPGGGASGTMSVLVNNPTPAISSLVPASAVVGSAATTVTVNGSAFVSGAQVTFAGAALATTFVSSTRLTALVPSALLAAAGSANVVVSNPAPAVAASGGAAFAINNPAPAISALSPSSANVGGASYVLTVTGSSFVGGATVQFGSTALSTTFSSATQLLATVPASAIAAAGTVNVTVTNPAPGGGTSSAMSVSVNNPAPALVSLSPSSAIAGSAALAITVTGTSFVSGSYVTFNGAALTTTFVSSTQLTASVPATSLATSGAYPVAVINPAPVGGTASLTFLVSSAEWSFNAALDESSVMPLTVVGNMALTNGLATNPNGSWGSYYRMASNMANLTPAAQNFTIDAWIYAPAGYGGNGDIGWFAFYNASNQPALRLYMSTSGCTLNPQFQIYFTTGAQPAMTTVTGTNLPCAQLFHVAFVRSGATGYFFVNGTLWRTFALGTTALRDVSTGYLAIDDGPGMQIASLRYTRGVALWTAAFTPPDAAIPTDSAAPSAISNLNAGTQTQSLSTVAASWTGATDTGGSGIDGYQMAVGTTPGATNVAAWTQVGNVGSAVLRGLSLTAGASYYVSVRAFDKAGNLGAVTTSGAIVGADAMQNFWDFSSLTSNARFPLTPCSAMVTGGVITGGGSYGSYGGGCGLAVPGYTDFDFGTGEFTIEFSFIAGSAYGGNGHLPFFMLSTTSASASYTSPYIELFINTNGSTIYAYPAVRSATNTDQTFSLYAGRTDLNVGTSNHAYVLERRGDRLIWMIDNTQYRYVDLAPGTAMGTFNAGKLYLIGLQSGWAGTGGIMDNLRITKGVARY